MGRRYRPFVLLVTPWLAACAPAIASADACRAASGERTLPVVELYTSEGCSSCPPADRWLSATFDPAGAPAVALAFHVDYWNKLGWPDRFARSEWTGRQSELARASRNPVVYTPQVTLQGRDFRDWRDGGLDAALRRTSGPPRAAVSLAVRAAGGRVAGAAEAVVDAREGPARSRVVVAWVDSGHVTEVARGENRGARLEHDHVVRELAVGDVTPAGSPRVTFDFAPPKEAGRDARLVAFVERADTREVLQAVVLPLAGCR